MGLRDKSRQAVAEKRAAKAQEAWEQGRRGYVLRVQALSSNKDETLTPILDEVLAIGWQLQSTAAVFNSTGINTEVVFFTFIRL
jgi:hypothetical protein